jgi:Co/Zn/Cd efflux system component
MYYHKSDDGNDMYINILVDNIVDRTSHVSWADAILSVLVSFWFHQSTFSVDALLIWSSSAKKKR